MAPICLRAGRLTIGVASLLLAATPLAARQAQTTTRDVVPATSGAAGARAPLPPLTQDAQQIIDQLTQIKASTIEQLRILQLTYRDQGRAEDAAVIAAHVRAMQQRTPPPSGTVSADLVHDGLPGRDEPVRMSMFRSRVGDTLSFAIRGRDDQLVLGTTTYTDDSALETAAVHAGMLRAGQMGIVKVRVLPGQDRYEAGNQNGVRSSAYGRHIGSFRFTAVSVLAPSRTASLSSYRDLVGHSIVVPVVGVVTGSVWGSDVYTDDSSLAAAVVHAGVLMPGEFGFVKVTLLPGQAHYDESTRGGVTSQPYDAWDGSFRVEPASPPWTVQLPGGEDASRLVPMSTMRGRTDVSFVVQVKGSAGPVWGTGTYSDDSSIAAAAVHAGLLKVNEVGLVRVFMTAGRESYAASEANGIKSQPYGPWAGSFRLERAGR
jgi:LCCL domain